MPVPAGNSEINIQIIIGGSTYNFLTSPIPVSGNLPITLPELEITSGSTNITCFVQITTGSVGFTLTEGSGSFFAYTHGSTKLIQPDSGFY